MTSALSEIQAEILYCIWLRQIWNAITPGATYREIFKDLTEPEGRPHPKTEKSVEMAVRDLKAYGFLEDTHAQPSQRLSRGPAPIAFKINTQTVITWPTTAELVVKCIRNQLGKDRLFQHIVDQGLIVHNTKEKLTLEELEKQLTYCLRQQYLDYSTEVPDHLKYLDRATRELPYLAKIARHCKVQPPVPGPTP